MEIGVPTSFIPHDATTPQQPAHYNSSGGLTDLFALIALVLFVASGVLAAGSYLYLQYLNSQDSQKQAEIQQAQAAFDPTLIKQLTTLDDRMNAANTILSSHIAPSAFFTALNQTTAATVLFQNLTVDATNLKHITLKMTGVARDVNSIAFQSDLFGKSGVINDAIFSGIDQQVDGVHFSVTATVNPSAMSYETFVGGQPASGVNVIPASTVLPTPTAPTSTTSGAVAPGGSVTGSSQQSAATVRSSGVVAPLPTRGAATSSQ